MVKSINLTFNDDDFEKLKEVKDGETWEKFILKKCLEEKDG